MILPTPVDAVDPAGIYGHDARPAPAGRPWVLVNMVASVDGSAIDAGGLSGGLSGGADKAVFSAIRAVADVIVAGAATVVAEDYGPSRPAAPIRRQRLARGRSEVPRIAVVSGSLRLDPGRRLFRDATPDARPIVLTADAADPERRTALEAVAEVHAVGRDRVDWDLALARLQAATGARVVLCEGGPRTVAQLVAADLIDEVCMTLSPELVGGPGPRLAQGPFDAVGLDLVLDRVLTEDGYLFLRYLRDRRDGRPPDAQ
jgi:riboflavin biosynthesis pyrimidine reductase